MPIVGFSYPFDEVREREKAAKDQEEDTVRKEPLAVQPDKLRFGYSIKGDSTEWKPVRVFDDRTKTYIQMPAEMKSYEAPAFFVIEDGSEPLLVNYRVKGDYYIVDRLFTRGQLRVGTNKTVDIVRGDSDGGGWFW